MLKLGFLREIKNISSLNLRVHIYFSQLHFLGCCVAAFLIKSDPDFNTKKLAYIQQQWNHTTEVKINILKWCVYQSVALGTFEEWKNGIQDYLTGIELQTLNSFMSLVKSNLQQ